MAPPVLSLNLGPPHSSGRSLLILIVLLSGIMAPPQREESEGLELQFKVWEV